MTCEQLGLIGEACRNHNRDGGMIFFVGIIFFLFTAFVWPGWLRKIMQESEDTLHRARARRPPPPKSPQVGGPEGAVRAVSCDPVRAAPILRGVDRAPLIPLARFGNGYAWETSVEDAPTPWRMIEGHIDGRTAFAILDANGRCINLTRDRTTAMMTVTAVNAMYGPEKDEL